MNRCSLPHRRGPAALHDAAKHAQQERDGRNKLVFDIAEIDARQYYREAGYESIHSYCMHELALSKKAAFHRIHVARKAWEFPAVLWALRAGRLHLTAVRALARHLTQENQQELVEATQNRPRAEIEALLAERFPKAQEPVSTLDVFTASAQVADGKESGPSLGAQDERLPGEVAPSLDQRPPGGVESFVTPAPSAPPVTRRIPLKLELDQETFELLERAREFLGHQVPSGNATQVIHHALKAFVRQAEKRKYGATDRPRSNENARSSRPGAISSAVRRAVSDRDGRRCTFVTGEGKRCPARRMLEYDHIEPVARGGLSTVENLRLRCRAHNQYAAEQVYGAEFMRQRREAARNQARNSPTDFR
jgi:hypothetical protein